VTEFHDGRAVAAQTAAMLLIILIVLAIVFLAGGFSTRGHSRYGSYSSPGIGLGGLLIIIVLVLFLTGNLHL
jgi:hypothetical protein